MRFVHMIVHLSCTIVTVMRKLDFLVVLFPKHMVVFAALQVYHGYIEHWNKGGLSSRDMSGKVCPALLRLFPHSFPPEYITNEQSFQLGHAGDAVSLAVTPDGLLVATGDISRRPAIILWRADNGEAVQVN